MQSELRYRVFIIDDHPVVVAGLAALFASEGDYVICGTARTRKEATSKLSGVHPDVVLIDLGVAGFSGLQLIQDLKLDHPGLRILAFSAHEEMFFAERSLRAGAMGYVMKSSEGSTLMAALRSVVRGNVYLSSKMERRVLCRFAGAPAGDGGSVINQLSNRELQVIHHIGESRDNRQIARLLSVSVKTVEAHRSKIKGKLRLRTTCDLIRFATRWVEHEGRFVK